MHDARQLVLLWHVIQQVPAQVTAVVVGRRRRGEAENACLDSYHAAPLREVWGGMVTTGVATDSRAGRLLIPACILRRRRGSIAL